MSQTSGLLPAFQSVKSLPPTFKFPGDPTLDPLEKNENVTLGRTDVIASSSPENGALGREVSEKVQYRAGDMDLFDEDSPYIEITKSLEGRNSTGDEGIESVPLPLPSISPSFREHRWSDTTPYALKKVLLVPDSNFTLLVLKLIILVL